MNKHFASKTSLFFLKEGATLFFVGSPSSGKSKILNMITTFCGKENVSNLTLKERDDHFRAVEIVGKTTNINADLEKAKIVSSGNFKNMVTRDSVIFERKYGKPFSHGNTAILISHTASIISNYCLPAVTTVCK